MLILKKNSPFYAEEYHLFSTMHMVTSFSVDKIMKWSMNFNRKAIATKVYKVVN